MKERIDLSNPFCYDIKQVIMMSRANREYHYSKKRKDRIYQKEKLITKKKMISSIKQLMKQGKYQKAYSELLFTTKSK